MKKFMIAALFGLMACNSEPTHSGKVKHGYDLTNKDVIPGAILVDAKDNVSDEDIKDLEKIAGTHLHIGNDTARQYKLGDGRVDPVDEEAILDRLNADPRVEHAEPMVRVHALWEPNDPGYAEEQWHMKRVGGPSVWNMTCARSVLVSVVDTGVATKLSDFENTSFSSGYDFVSNDDDAEDLQGHGSHCAGTVAQSTNNGHGGAGLAYCATIIPVRVLDENGSGTMENVALGIRYAADQGAQVISLSLGSSHPSDVVEDAVNYAHDNGSIVIAAAGNSGQDDDVGYPARYKNAVAIGASNEQDNIADFSSRGPEVALAAPGTNVYQQTIKGAHGCRDENGCFEKFNGTSMATPHSAAAAALIASMGITDPDAIKAKLQSTADAKDDPDAFGAGILRADSAVRSTVFNHTMWRLIGLTAILFFLRKKINMAAVKSKLSIAGTVFAGFGIVPLFFVGLMPRLGSVGFLAELVARPLGEMNLPLGFMVHYLPLANFLPAGLAVLLLLNSKLKNFAGGIALGSAALLSQMFWSADMFYFAGSLIMRVMLGASVGVCIYLVKTVFEKKA